MLLAQKPTSVFSSVTKHEVAESEIDYQQSVSTYVPRKRAVYVSQGFSLMDATVAAIKAAEKRVDDPDSSLFRFSILSAIHDIHNGGFKKSKVALTLESPSDSDKSLARFEIKDSLRNQWEFLTPNADTLIASTECAPTEIPSMGYYTLAWRSESTGSPKQQLQEMYDLHSVHALKAALREGSSKRAIIKLPCYSPSVAAKISNLGLPATEMHLIVKISADSSVPEKTSKLSCTLVGLRFVCTAQADAHSVLYTNAAHFDDHPTFATKASATAALSQSVYHKQPSASETSASAYSSVAQTITGQLEQYFAKATKRLVPFSWSVSHNDQVVFSHRGLDRHPIGQVGEVFVGLAAIRAAYGVSPSVWSDTNLMRPQGLEKLLIKAGSDKVLAALRKLYAGKRLPSVLELLTHTSGLPHVGSIDAEVDYKLLESILPGPATENGVPLPDGAEERFARMLEERVTLVAGPGEVAHSSVLGYAVLRYCFVNLNATLAKLFEEFGMSSTVVVPPPTVAASSSSDTSSVPQYPGDDTYQFSNCGFSTANDLARFIASIEKSVQDPNAHPLLAASLLPQYLAIDYGKSGMYSVCSGGMENCTMRVQLKQCASARKSDRVSLSVFFKFGDRPAQGSSMVVWIPGLHMGFSLCFSASLNEVFGKTHADVGYGKHSTDKAFMAKHLIKSVLERSAAALSVERGACFDLDQAADIAYAVTPKLPPGYREYSMRCANADDEPGTPWKELIESSPLFKGQGVEFYPLFHAVNEIRRQVAASPASVSIPIDSVLKQLKSLIRISKRVIEHSGAEASGPAKSGVFLEDTQSEEITQLVYDKNIQIRVGRSVAEQLGMSSGGFRKVSEHRRGDLTEALTLHILPDKAVGIHHHGCIYVSRQVILEMKNQLEESRQNEERTRLQNKQQSVSQNYYFWKTVQPDGSSSTRDKQQPIAANAGAVVGAGLLGLGVGAVAGASLAAPYHRPYYYYPPPVYPRPYYYRRRRRCNPYTGVCYY